MSIAGAPLSCNNQAGPSNEESVAYTIEHLRERQGAARSPYYRTMDELLPNVSFRLPSGDETAVTAAVVVGTITEVRPGRAYVEEETQREVDFGDPSADWKTLHLEVEVQESVGASVGDRVMVGLVVGREGETSQLQDGLESLGRVLLFLTDQSAVFAYDPGLYSIVEDGGVLATVGDNDVIRLPLKEARAAAAFQGRIRTMADLRAAAAEPRRVVPLTDEHGLVTRDEGISPGG